MLAWRSLEGFLPKGVGGPWRSKGGFFAYREGLDGYKGKNGFRGYREGLGDGQKGLKSVIFGKKGPFLLKGGVFCLRGKWMLKG